MSERWSGVASLPYTRGEPARPPTYCPAESKSLATGGPLARAQLPLRGLGGLDDASCALAAWTRCLEATDASTLDAGYASLPAAQHAPHRASPVAAELQRCAVGCVVVDEVDRETAGEDGVYTHHTTIERNPCDGFGAWVSLGVGGDPSYTVHIPWALRPPLLPAARTRYHTPPAAGSTSPFHTASAAAAGTRDEAGLRSGSGNRGRRRRALRRQLLCARRRGLGRRRNGAPARRPQHRADLDQTAPAGAAGCLPTAP